MKRLLSTAYDPNARDVDGDRVPLHWAAARGEVRCIELLLAAGADARICDAEGRTPAGLALVTGQITAYNLLELGPVLADAKRAFEGIQRISLHAALNEPVVLKQILNSPPPPDVNVRDADGDRFPLHWAAARGSVRCAQLLIGAGADLAALDGAGRTPAALALAQHQMGVHEVITREGVEERGQRASATAQQAVQQRTGRVMGLRSLTASSQFV